MLSTGTLKDELTIAMSSQYMTAADAATGWASAFTNYYKEILNPLFTGMTEAQAETMKTATAAGLISSGFGITTTDPTGVVFAGQLTAGLVVATAKIVEFSLNDATVISSVLIAAPPLGAPVLTASLTGIFAATSALVAGGVSISIEETVDLITAAISVYSLTGTTTSPVGAVIPWDASLVDLEAAEEELEEEE